MASAPEVTVVIPAYNIARYIGEALQSVHAQTFRDFEIIVIDDGSTDGTADRAAEAAPGALVLRRANGGPGAARNAGIARARGRLIAFLDGDDVWYPHALETLVALAHRHAEAGLVHAEMEGDRRSLPSNGTAQHRFCEIFHQVHHVPIGAVIVPLEVLQAVGGFDERREIYVEDFELYLRIAARYPIAWEARPVLWHRPGGVMSSAAEKTYRGQQLTVEKSLPLCREACPQHRADPMLCMRRRLHLTHQLHGRALLRAGQNEAARRALGAALAERPLALRTRLMHAASFLSEATLARLYDARDQIRRFW